MGKVDLHLHSNASDGKYSPAELVNLAARAGLTIIALTDHDSTEGIAPALAAALSIPELKVIPGVEIGTDVPHGEVHILGYFIDYEDKKLNETLARLRHSRLFRANKMLEKLNHLGIKIEWERVQELAGSGAVGRPHVARAMLEKGYINSIKEAFDKYIGREGPAYVEREKMSPEEAVGLVKDAQGLPVLAHPGTVPELEQLLTRLKGAGILGIEVYYSQTLPRDIKKFKQLALHFGLVITGGSDFHGLNAGFEVPLGETYIPDKCAADLIALARKLNRFHDI